MSKLYKDDDFFCFNQIPLTLGQFVNKHISVFLQSRPVAGLSAKVAQFGLPVLLISTLSVLSRPTVLVVCSKNLEARRLSFLLAVVKNSIRALGTHVVVK